MKADWKKVEDELPNLSMFVIAVRRGDGIEEPWAQELFYRVLPSGNGTFWLFEDLEHKVDDVIKWDYMPGVD